MKELLATIAAQEHIGRNNPALDESTDFIDIIRRDYRLPLPPTGFVPQHSRPDKKVRITLQEGDSYIGNNVLYKGFTTDNKIPGPTIIVDEGDIVEFTTVRWINEDVFTYMEGEFSGIHNMIVKTGPERFASPMLAHAESWSNTVTKEGEYTYICTPHPYMEGRIIVSSDHVKGVKYASAGPAARSGMLWFALVIAALALMVAIIGLIPK